MRRDKYLYQQRFEIATYEETMYDTFEKELSSLKIKTMKV